MNTLSHFDAQVFMRDYWQKKPLLIKKALPGFQSLISAEELAGLALEEEIESRIVIQSGEQWSLKRGPFTSEDFQKLPPNHWTLLVQGVDRFVPEVADLCAYFHFIPHWRFDDVMISYATEGGGVGPHYDNYDVFLLQGQGTRKWMLTSQECHESNYREGLELRIMQRFITEDEFVLEPGDILYLPPHMGHYGVALSDDCMTYSFGYRSYPAKELVESFSEYLYQSDLGKNLYRDPAYYPFVDPGKITLAAMEQFVDLMNNLLHDKKQLAQWFGCFMTKLDEQSEQMLVFEPGAETMNEFMQELAESNKLVLNPFCRIAYQEDFSLNLFINGESWSIEQEGEEMLRILANKKEIKKEVLDQYLKKNENCIFLLQLWQRGWLECI